MHFKTKIYRHVLSRFDFKRVITLDNNPIQKPNGRRSLEGKGRRRKKKKKKILTGSIFILVARFENVAGWVDERAGRLALEI